MVSELSSNAVLTWHLGQYSTINLRLDISLVTFGLIAVGVISSLPLSFTTIHLGILVFNSYINSNGLIIRLK